MATWKKVALFTLLLVVVFGIRFYLLWRERNEPVSNPRQHAQRALTADEIVQPRKLYIDSLRSAQVLVGKTVWMQAGYELAYYPYTKQRIDFSKRAGLIAPIQAMAISAIFPAKAPLSTQRLVPIGTWQIFAAFTMAGDAKQYATAIGYEDGGDAKYYCDDVFFYDDPHTLYPHWSPEVWKAVDAHTAVAGMNERQAAMSLGMIQRSSDMNPASYGNRTVTYDTDIKRWSVTFEKDKATRASSAPLPAE